MQVEAHAFAPCDASTTPGKMEGARDWISEKRSSDVLHFVVCIFVVNLMSCLRSRLLKLTFDENIVELFEDPRKRALGKSWLRNRVFLL